MCNTNQDCKYWKAFKTSQDKKVAKYLRNKLGAGYDDGHLADLCAEMTDNPTKHQRIINLLTQLNDGIL